MTAHDSEIPGFLNEKPPRVISSIDWTVAGKQHGYLSVPYSANESAWGSVRIPITVIKNGEGPTVFFIGGNHGDEYEGPIALKKLASSLEPEICQGRVIITPCLNQPAVQANARCSPLDGLNMNRNFPGRRTGSVTEMICHYVTYYLLPKADAVIDIHSGGRTLNFVPFAAMHFLDDSAATERSRRAIDAFDAPISLTIREPDTEGMIDEVVEAAGKVFLFTELGGAGTATPETVEIAHEGSLNVLRHFGILEGSPSRREDRGLEPARVMTTPDNDAYTVSDESGLFECLVDLGDRVETGQLIGRVHSIEKTDCEPGAYYAHTNGVLIGRHHPGRTSPGDCLAVIGVD